MIHGSLATYCAIRAPCSEKNQRFSCDYYWSQSTPHGHFSRTKKKINFIVVCSVGFTYPGHTIECFRAFVWDAVDAHVEQQHSSENDRITFWMRTNFCWSNNKNRRFIYVYDREESTLYIPYLVIAWIINILHATSKYYLLEFSGHCGIFWVFEITMKAHWLCYCRKLYAKLPDMTWPHTYIITVNDMVLFFQVFLM